MSRLPIDRSSDLTRLQNDGYDIEIREGHLLVKDVPYVNENRQIKRGILVSTLNLNNDVTQPPETHVTYFIGEYPCNVDGSKITQIQHGNNQVLGPDLAVNFSFSNKPASGYPNYYEKMTTYATILSSPAEAIDPNVTPKTFAVIKNESENPIFQYSDTASNRAGITNITSKLRNHKIAIVGLGGTGAYVLDLLAKTPVREIHLYDHDDFQQHNAFRAPGAASTADLELHQKKVGYYTSVYSRMRKNVFPHPYNIDASNLDELSTVEFVFLCLDSGPAKQVIVDKLQAHHIQFIDSGIGVNEVDGKLSGQVRVTACSANKNDHVLKHITFMSTDGGNNEYDKNIQIADLNALNAALAVIKWKKMCGFYDDIRNEHHMIYTTSVNFIVNEECQ
ncbi:MAG: ThiF family adenylyltransferase [Methanoregula sp.]